MFPADDLFDTLAVSPFLFDNEKDDNDANAPFLPSLIAVSSRRRS